MNSREAERAARQRAEFKEEEITLLGEKQEIPVDKLLRLAREYSRHGFGEEGVQLLTGTLQRVRKIRDPALKSEALLRLSFAFNAAGQLYTAAALIAEARQAADGAASPSLRCRAWLNMAREYLRAEKIDDCRDLLDRVGKEANQIREETDRSEILSLLADTYLETGDRRRTLQVISRAREAAAGIDSISARAWSLIKIHDTYARMKEEETALQILSEAFRITRVLQPPLSRDRKLSAISSKYARLGRYEDAPPMQAQAAELGIQLSDADKRWAGIAIFRKAHRLFQERGYPSKLMAASMRLGPVIDGVTRVWHLEKLAGANAVLTVFPNIFEQWIQSYQTLPLESQIDEPIPDEALERLLRIPYFVQAYEEEGIAPGDWVHHPALQATAGSFAQAMEKVEQFAADVIGSGSMAGAGSSLHTD